jgi:hypothetical protein
MPRLLALLLFGGACLVAGCDHRIEAAESSEGPRVVETVRPTVVNEIRWFKGSMEQALAAATQDNKPLMVYWGAK